MVGSDSTFRDEFLTGAARAFFTMAYADYCESQDGECDLPQPGPGEDWVDYTPEAPPNAYAIAGEMWARIEVASNASIYVLADRATEADGKSIDPEEFGFCLAMQYMGTGVAWDDNHKPFAINVPSHEVSFMSFDPECYGNRMEDV